VILIVYWGFWTGFGGYLLLERGCGSLIALGSKGYCGAWGWLELELPLLKAGVTEGEFANQFKPFFYILALAIATPKLFMLSYTFSPVFALTSSVMYPYFSAIFFILSGLTTRSQSDLFPSNSTLMLLSQ
jgi:hypothetical protein